MKNDCDIVKDLLPIYVENMCSSSTNEYIKTHLESCSDCNELYLIMNEPLNITTETISEKKVFSKIKNKYKKQLFGSILICTLIALLFGTNLISEVTKLRFKIYLKNNYPQHNLELSGFKYVDMETLGFGSSGAYVADVYAEDEENNPDLKFSLSTNNFSFKITDNYDYQIKESKNPTEERLLVNYTNDLEYTLSKNSTINFMPVHIDFTIDTPSPFELNMPYTKSIDQINPTSVILSYIPKTFNLEEIINNINSTISLIETNGFNPKYYTFDIYINQNDAIRIEDSTQKLKNSKYLEETIKKAFKESNFNLV